MNFFSFISFAQVFEIFIEKERLNYINTRINPTWEKYQIYWTLAICLGLRLQKIHFASKCCAILCLYQRLIWGDPHFLWSFVSPYLPLFYCISINRFSKIFKMWSFMSGNFSRKFSRKFPQIFSTFSKSSNLHLRLSAHPCTGASCYRIVLPRTLSSSGSNSKRNG